MLLLLVYICYPSVICCHFTFQDLLPDLQEIVLKKSSVGKFCLKFSFDDLLSLMTVGLILNIVYFLEGVEVGPIC